MARKERREGSPDRDRDRDYAETEMAETERDSLVALKAILIKVAGLLKPLGLNPEEAVGIVQRMYESVLEMDVKLAGEPDDTRRAMFLEHVQNAGIHREDDELVIDYQD